MRESVGGAKPAVLK